MLPYSATCSCASLSVMMDAEPVLQAVCNCRDCQSRTGSAFGMSVFFPKDKVTFNGESTLYRRVSNHGRHLDFRFCPVCGTSVWWTSEALPDNICVAGSLIDKLAFRPDLVIFCESRAEFVSFETEARFFERGSRDGAAIDPRGMA